MSGTSDRVYALSGDSVSDQAQASSVNPAAGTVQMRILIELQVLSVMMHRGLGITDDLAKLRQDVADSIT